MWSVKFSLLVYIGFLLLSRTYHYRWIVCSKLLLGENEHVNVYVSVCEYVCNIGFSFRMYSYHAASVSRIILYLFQAGPTVTEDDLKIEWFFSLPPLKHECPISLCSSCGLWTSAVNTQQINVENYIQLRYVLQSMFCSALSHFLLLAHSLSVSLPFSLFYHPIAYALVSAPIL